MAWLVRSLLLCALVLAAACSVEGTIERLTSPEDRAFSQRFVEFVRTGREEALRPEFDGELWARSRSELAKARALYPPGKGETKLIGFNIATNVVNGLLRPASNMSSSPPTGPTGRRPESPPSRRTGRRGSSSGT